MARKKRDRHYYYEAEWVAGGVYHVYNCAVQPNELLRTREEYSFFVELIRDRVTAFALVFAYALLPNHFHLAIRLLDEETLRARILAKPPSKRWVKERGWLAGQVPFRQLIGDYWATMFSVYTSFYNPRAHRRGTLLDQTLRRIRVRADLISRHLIMYIHTNEVKHHILSSYLNSGLRTSFGYYGLERDDHWLARDLVLERFGGLDNFLGRHVQYVRKYGSRVSGFDEELYFKPSGDRELFHTPYVPFLEDAPPRPSELVW